MKSHKFTQDNYKVLWQWQTVVNYIYCRSLTVVEENESEQLENQTKKPTQYYRYDGVHIRHNCSIYLSSFEVVGTTPKGIYINTFDHSKKLILNDWVKKYAHPTKEEALLAFIKRKEREIAILESRLQFAKNYLKIATSDDVEGYVTDGMITLELGDFFK